MMNFHKKFPEELPNLHVFITRLLVDMKFCKGSFCEHSFIEYKKIYNTKLLKKACRYFNENYIWSKKLNI